MRSVQNMSQIKKEYSYEKDLLQISYAYSLTQNTFLSK